MLASLAAFSALAWAQNQQFPKPDTSTPPALLNSANFKYLADDEKGKDWRPFPASRDWSSLSIPSPKPNALRVKVLLTVAERDFSNPQYSNTLESRDKTRLLEAAGRLKSLYSVLSDGSIVLDIVPRFYAEPMYSVKEFTDLIDNEYNKTKFESDDSTERGPFAAILAISSSHVEVLNDPNTDYEVKGFADLNGSSGEMWLEENLFRLMQRSVKKRLARHFADYGVVAPKLNQATNLLDELPGLTDKYAPLLDPNYRQDAELLTRWSQMTDTKPDVEAPRATVAVKSPGQVEEKEGALVYSEISLMRAGEFALPQSAKLQTAKSLSFEIKTVGRNPLAVHVWLTGSSSKDVEQVEYVMGEYPSMIPIKGDNNWQSVTIPIENGGRTVTGISIGTPREFAGTTRIRAELNQYWFRGFDLSGIASPSIRTTPVFAPATWESEESFRDTLMNGTKYAKRQALRSPKIREFKGLEPLLFQMTSDIDMGVAHDATMAYFDSVLAGPATAESNAILSKYLTNPPNEAAREVALEFAIKNPSFTSFGPVSACSVRENWHVRRRAIEALGALYRANVREKLACKELIRFATNQDLATIRKAAVQQMDPNIQADLDRLIHVMVNDPCESVRLASLAVLAKFEQTPKDKLLGTAADDSPSFRELIPQAMGNNPALREVLDRMVVDQDPYVRSAALRGLAQLGPIPEAEIQNTFGDNHPAVQLEVLRGAKAGRWKLPAEVVTRLKGSPVRSIATLAAEIQ